MKKLTIVIPAKNEAESLPTVLDQFVYKDFYTHEHSGRM